MEAANPGIRASSPPLGNRHRQSPERSRRESLGWQRRLEVDDEEPMSARARRFQAHRHERDRNLATAAAAAATTAANGVMAAAEGFADGTVRTAAGRAMRSAIAVAAAAEALSCGATASLHGYPALSCRRAAVEVPWNQRA